MANVIIRPDRTGSIQHGITFSVFFIWDEDVTGFTTDDISTSTSTSTKGAFSGSGRIYRQVFTANSDARITIDSIIVAENAVAETNPRTTLTINYGASVNRPSVIEATNVIGDSLVYTPTTIYTMKQNSENRFGTLRSYSFTGILGTTTDLTYQGEIRSLAGQTDCLEILNNRFLISANRRINPINYRTGLSLASAAVPNTTFSNFFIDVGSWSSSGATIIQDIAVSASKIYVLYNTGLSTSASSFTVGIYDLDGSSDSSFTISTRTRGTDTYYTVPTSLAVTSEFIYVGFRNLRASPSSFGGGASISGNKLYAYSLTGTRMTAEDLDLGDLSGTASTFRIQGLDWDETNNTIWMLVDRGTYIRPDFVRKLASLSLAPAARPAFATISNQILEAGDSLDLNPFSTGVDEFIFGVGYTPPAWLSLSGGRLTVATSNLPTASVSTSVSIIGIGQGDPAFLTFPLTLNRPAPPVIQPIPTLHRDEGETVNLNDFIQNADTISFRSGQTIPLGLTMSNGIISIPPNAVMTDTQVTVHITAQNPLLTVHGQFELIVSNSAIDIRNLSFQKTTPAWEVILGGQNISADILSVDNISHSLDLQNTGEFLVAEATVNISNSPRRYQRNGEFYTTNNINPFTADIVISGSFGEVKRRMFTGQVLGIRESIDGQSVSLLCVDSAKTLRNSIITDFGVEKRQIALSDGEESFEGSYSVPEALIPISDNSLSGTTEGRALNVIEDQSLKVYGRLDPLNVKATESALTSEGGLLPSPPVVSFKTPFLYRPTNEYLLDLLQHFNIHSHNIETPRLIGEQHFASVGRTGFNEEFSGIIRYAKDWIYNDGVFYILAGSPYATAQDYLWEWHVEDKQWNLIGIFSTSHEMWQLASSDFNVFYILGTQSRVDINLLPNGTYDASEGASGSPSLVKIWTFTKSTETLTELITGSDNYPPTLAQFYSVGFTREHASSDRFGKIPDTRGGFAIRENTLYYRFANATSFGVAAASLPSGSTSAFITASGSPDNFGSAAGLAFHINGDRMYVGYTNAPTDASTLTLVSRSFTSSALTTIARLNDPTSGNNRYALTGILEIFVHGTNCYFVTQRHPRNNDSPFTRETHQNASAVLYQVNTTGGTPSVLKEYDYCQIAARSFVVHQDKVHFFEGSHIAYRYEPRRPFDLPRDPEEEIIPAEWKNKIGFLQRIETDRIEEVGIVWRSALQNPNDGTDTFYGIHGGMCSPMHSVDGKLYLIAGYGDFNQIGQRGAEINNVYNDAIILYGTDIELRIPRIETNGKTGYALLQEIAQSTNSLFGFNHQRFFWQNRQSLEAQLSTHLTSDASSLNFKNPTSQFPDSGFLRIGSEVMQYTGLSNTQLTGLTRGISGTSIGVHGEDSDILYIDHVIIGSGATSPINNVSVNDDYTNLYNSVFINYGGGASTYHVEDAESITQYGRREYAVDTMLHFTQQDWAKSLGDNYLRTFKDLEQVLYFQSDLALFLSVGDVIYLSTREITTAARIYELEHDFQLLATNVSARTISERETTPVFFTDATWGTGVWGTFTWGISR